jgi:hypothetical protein
LFFFITGNGKKHEILKKVAKGGQFVCTLCWETNSVPMIKAVISAYKYNPSNCKDHIRTSHIPSEVPGLFSDVSTITHANSEVTLKTNKATKQNSILNYQSNAGEIATPQIALSHLYNFFNEANIAIVQANNEHLSNFIRYLLDNAQNLKARRTECLFSRYKYMNQRDDRFLKFVSSLKELVHYSRNYYFEKFKKTIPFICVSHDGWDSKDHDVLGVCVHFVVPGYWKVVNLAAGLKRIRSKKSVATAKAIHIILKRYVFYSILLGILLYANHAFFSDSTYYQRIYFVVSMIQPIVRF